MLLLSPNLPFKLCKSLLAQVVHFRSGCEDNLYVRAIERGDFIRDGWRFEDKGAGSDMSRRTYLGVAIVGALAFTAAASAQNSGPVIDFVSMRTVVQRYET